VSALALFSSVSLMLMVSAVSFGWRRSMIGVIYTSLSASLRPVALISSLICSATAVDCVDSRFFLNCNSYLREILKDHINQIKAAPTIDSSKQNLYLLPHPSTTDQSIDHYTD
jgi:hypothetical protein